MELRFKAGDLSPEQRAAVEAMLGQKLSDTDTVKVGAEKAPEAAREEQERAAAADRFLESAREMHKRVADVPEEELYALIDEAVDQVRHNRG